MVRNQPLLHEDRDDGEAQRADERKTDARRFAPRVDEHAAEQRAQRHGDAAHEGMHGDPHGPLVLRQKPRNHVHGRRERDGRPRQEEERADDHRDPRGNQDHDQESRHRQQVEHQQRPLGSEAIGKVSAGKRVERGQQNIETVEQADGQGPAAQRHEVDRQEALGHSLAHAHQNDHREQSDHAAAQPEKRNGRVRESA